MNAISIAPCGLNCELCNAFQRLKNTCTGCNGRGFKPSYCQSCRIRNCPEKQGVATALCGDCAKYPCKRIKDLDKRYRVKYGESPVANFADLKALGMSSFMVREETRWLCPACGRLLSVHKGVCPHCGAPNPHYPAPQTRD
jgi:hypothetical protein